jgi:hypothetical protein
MTLVQFLALVFVELHGPTGQVLEINPAEVSSLRQPLDAALGHRHWTAGTKCIVVMTNGGVVAVAEDCPTVVQKMMGQAK